MPLNILRVHRTSIIRRMQMIQHVDGGLCTRRLGLGWGGTVCRWKYWIKHFIRWDSFVTVKWGWLPSEQFCHVDTSERTSPKLETDIRKTMVTGPCRHCHARDGNIKSRIGSDDVNLPIVCHFPQHFPYFFSIVISLLTGWTHTLLQCINVCHFHCECEMATRRPFIIFHRFFCYTQAILHNIYYTVEKFDQFIIRYLLK